MVLVPLMTAPPHRRLAAKFFDLLIVIIIASLSPGAVGPILGLLYILSSDRILRGQSIGKRLMRLRVIPQVKQRTITWIDSVCRNLPAGVATFFALIPLWGWVVMIVIGFPLLLLEIFRILRVQDARTIGDLMGDTRVIDSRPTA